MSMDVILGLKKLFLVCFNGDSTAGTLYVGKPKCEGTPFAALNSVSSNVHPLTRTLASNTISKVSRSYNHSNDVTFSEKAL